MTQVNLLPTPYRPQAGAGWKLAVCIILIVAISLAIVFIPDWSAPPVHHPHH